jgi:alkanesulfonate monooxygenase SsuD/methylene tetrahydromethanopterin reductase-like flavin-dependent oxidoreductase (luciferase family)
LDAAVEAERRGLDYVAVQDHPYQRRFVDAFVAVGDLDATETVGPMTSSERCRA